MIPKEKLPWERAARRRRLIMIVLILVTTLIASSYMADLLPGKGTTALEIAIIAVFGALFAWISIGFWESIAGLYTLLRRADRFAITKTITDADGKISPEVRTAILIPVCNEDVNRVFAGLEATYKSLAATGLLDQFDFFVLSDSSNPDCWVAEEIAWYETCQALNGFNRIFYRHRRVNIKRKSGNIADFCRRWGRNYRYMIVFDADSIMAGQTLVHMVRIMEKNPRVGILQTAPLAVNKESLIARVQQFSNHVYGPMFVAGLHFTQLGDSHFWGHNAILRIEAFMKHCGLPQLPGKPPLGGEILSHDFVEAALMRKAGYEVWLAYDLTGSYEELPPTLLEELKRDRRWCQGNMQHMRLVFAKGLFPAHRALFLHGAMAYVSALLWFLFLSLSSAEAIYEAIREPVYFPAGRSLFPQWPVWHPRWALTLLATTAIILFLPKLLSVMVIMIKRAARGFGGVTRLLCSMVAEVVFSTLFAPMRMLFHSKFVFLTLLGQEVGWGGQQRSDRGTGWGEAARMHATGTITALLWAATLFLFNRSFFWWNLPIYVPILLSIPLSVWSSQARLGRAFRRAGLFLIPEEIAPPYELRVLKEQEARMNQPNRTPMPDADNFVRAVVNPQVNVLHRTLLRKKRTVSPAIVERRRQLQEKALGNGPQVLSTREKKELLCDPQCMEELHRRVWEITDPALAAHWGLAA